MRRITSSSSSSAADLVAVTWPSRSTVIESHSSKASCSRWVMKTTAQPSSRLRRIRRKSRSTWSTVSDAVVSSKTRMRHSLAMTLATSVKCWASWEMERTRADDCSGSPARSSTAWPAACTARHRMIPRLAGTRPRQHVLPDGEVGTDLGILEHDAYACLQAGPWHRGAASAVPSTLTLALVGQRSPRRGSASASSCRSRSRRPGRRPPPPRPTGRRTASAVRRRMLDDTRMRAVSSSAPCTRSTHTARISTTPVTTPLPQRRHAHQVEPVLEHAR